MIVYLDSKDFIQLTDERDDPNVAEIWQFLINAVDTNQIIIGYSFLHIVEVLNPDSRGFEESQQAYGETIARLCSITFPFISDVIEGATYTENEIWGPTSLQKKVVLDYDAKYFTKLARQKLSEHPSLTRQERRALSKPKNLVQMLLRQDAELPTEMSFFGLSKTDFVQMINSPARSRKRVQQKLMRLMSDPREYCSVVSKVKPGEDPIRKLIDEQFRATSLSLHEIWQQGRLAIELAKTMEVSLRNLEDQGLKGTIAFETLRAKRQELRRIHKGIEIRDERLSHPRFDFLPSYIERMVEIEKPPSSSEIRDILHLFYAHDVDYFSVDSKMFEKVKKAPALGSKVYGRLTDLKKAIEKELNSLP